MQVGSFLLLNYFFKPFKQFMFSCHQQEKFVRGTEKKKCADWLLQCLAAH
jgi:hypothetical protein